MEPGFPRNNAESQRLWHGKMPAAIAMTSSAPASGPSNLAKPYSYGSWYVTIQGEVPENDLRKWGL